MRINDVLADKGANVVTVWPDSRLDHVTELFDQRAIASVAKGKGGDTSARSERSRSAGRGKAAAATGGGRKGSSSVNANGYGERSVWSGLGDLFGAGIRGGTVSPGARGFDGPRTADGGRQNSGHASAAGGRGGGNDTGRGGPGVQPGGDEDS